MTYCKIFFSLLLSIGLCLTISVAQVDSSLVSVDDKITHRILLIGDAGEPAKDFQEPVLEALYNEASTIPENTFVIFLGDNIYSNGLPDEDDPERKEFERRIDEQINAVTKAGANGLFIPGNHDWSQGDNDGWEKIKRQSDYVNNKKNNVVEFLPTNGCSGPIVKDFTDYHRIIVLDSQWWFQDKHFRPEKDDQLCSSCTEEEIINSLDSILNISQDKFVIIVSHHPLSTHGPHGGYFTWQDHIFPLTNLNEYLWLPLPIVGSLYPLARVSGFFDQDISSDDYQNFKIQIESVLSKYSGLVHASGHEHALQILRGVNDNLYIVSGAGIWEHVERSIGEADDTIFTGSFEGFVSLDFLSDDRIRLDVIRVVNVEGEIEKVYSMWLDE